MHRDSVYFCGWVQLFPSGRGEQVPATSSVSVLHPPLLPPAGSPWLLSNCLRGWNANCEWEDKCLEKCERKRKITQTTGGFRLVCTKRVTNMQLRGSVLLKKKKSNSAYSQESQLNRSCQQCWMHEYEFSPTVLVGMSSLLTLSCRPVTER